MSANEVVADLAARLAQAMNTLYALADDARAKSDYDEARRLKAKAEGVDLARDYLRAYQ